MSDVEKAMARAQAAEAASRASRSANRERLWAGLNRYLAAESEHQHKAAHADEETEPESQPESQPAEEPEPDDDEAR